MEERNMKKYKYLSQCKDFKRLSEHYSKEQLEDFERAIIEYEDSGTSEENFEEQAYCGHSDIINWYEGLITTEDLFDNIEAIESKTITKSFYITRIEYGLVSIEVPEGATEEQEKELVRRAEQNGQADFYNSEITDITEAGIDS